MNGFDLGPQALEADRRRLLALLTEKSYAKKKVVLSSGRESDFYIDCKKTVLTAEGHWLVGRLLYAQVRREAPQAVGVGGLTMGADPIASSVCLISHLAPPVSRVRLGAAAGRAGARVWAPGFRSALP